MSHNTCCLQQEKRQDGLIYRSASGEEGGLGVAKSFSALPIAWNVASSHFSFLYSFFDSFKLVTPTFHKRIPTDWCSGIGMLAGYTRR